MSRTVKSTPPAETVAQHKARLLAELAAVEEQERQLKLASDLAHGVICLKNIDFLIALTEHQTDSCTDANPHPCASRCLRCQLLATKHYDCWPDGLRISLTSNLHTLPH